MTFFLVPIALLAAGLWLGLRLRDRSAVRRGLSVSLFVAAIALGAAGFQLSFAYAGQPARFPPGSADALMRAWVIAPLVWCLFAVPGLLAFAATQWLPAKLRPVQAGAAAAALAVLSAPFCFMFLLLAGCNFTGACL